MRAGQLKHLLSIERVTEIQNSFGEPVREWQEVSKAYGAIYPIRGIERYMSMEKHAKATHEINIRYISITPKDRIIYQNRVFEIISILNLGERNRQLKIIVEEQV